MVVVVVCLFISVSAIRRRVIPPGCGNAVVQKSPEVFYQCVALRGTSLHCKFWFFLR